MGDGGDVGLMCSARLRQRFTQPNLHLLVQQSLSPAIEISILMRSKTLPYTLTCQEYNNLFNKTENTLKTEILFA